MFPLLIGPTNDSAIQLLAALLRREQLPFEHVSSLTDLRLAHEHRSGSTHARLARRHGAVSAFVRSPYQIGPGLENRQARFVSNEWYAALLSACASLPVVINRPSKLGWLAADLRPALDGIAIAKPHEFFASSWDSVRRTAQQHENISQLHVEDLQTYEQCVVIPQQLGKPPTPGPWRVRLARSLRYSCVAVVAGRWWVTKNELDLSEKQLGGLVAMFRQPLATVGIHFYVVWFGEGSNPSEPELAKLCTEPEPWMLGSFADQVFSEVASILTKPRAHDK